MNSIQCRKVAEAEAQVGVLLQVRDRADVQAVGEVLLHAEHVGVVESKRPAHPDAEFGQSGADLRLADQHSTREQDLRDRPGVIHIGVDLADFQAVEQNAPAEVALVLGSVAFMFGDEIQHLAENGGLGELLRADANDGPSFFGFVGPAGTTTRH